MTTITRVFDLLKHIQKKFQKEDIIAGKHAGKWTKYSTNQFLQLVDETSRGLLTLGIKKDDKVAIMSPNRPEWTICDFGIIQIGAVQVPMYPTLAEDDIRFILKDVDIKILFVHDKILFDKLNSILSDSHQELKIFLFDEAPGLPYWHEIIELGKKHPDIDLQKYKDNVTPDDLLTLIYTSGTTGTPKGVMLTHHNLVSNVLASSEMYPEHFSKALSFLPLSHIFERMVIYLYLYRGSSIYYAESIDTIVADINEVKPHGFTTVPRLLEKIYDRIIAKGQELTGIKRHLFFWALHLGLRYELAGKNGWWYEFQLWIANKLIFSKWRKALGNHIMVIVSGGAALQPRLARIFWAAKVPVIEGYGLTETSPVISVNGLRKGDTKFTTVGKPIGGVEVKIASDGEILCKGPNVMKGYYNHPNLTAETIDTDGFFHTGDIGELVDGTYLRITDRKKEIFKTAGGKYVTPQALENKFKESIFIEQVMVFGENRKFPAAFIVPAFDILKSWCAEKGILYTTPTEMVKNSTIIEKYQREIDHYNAKFGQWERVKKFELLPKEWSVDGGELTPKLSLKRKVILHKNENLVDKIYLDTADAKV